MTRRKPHKASPELRAQLRCGHPDGVAAVRDALTRADGRTEEAARMLGLSIVTLRTAHPLVWAEVVALRIGSGWRRGVTGALSE